MGPGEVFGLLIVVAVPALLIVYMARRFFTFREKQLEAETSLAAEKAAQYAASNAQLEALREPPARLREQTAKVHEQSPE